VLREKEWLEVAEVPEPSLASDHVLVKVSKCGICGSDVRYFHGENPWAKQTLQQEIPNPPNIILGHQFAGTVVNARDAADRGLIGKRVGVNTFTTCGRCRHCRAGRENLCRETKHLGHGQGWGKMDLYPGGMAEYCPVAALQVYELPAHVRAEVRRRIRDLAPGGGYIAASVHCIQPDVPPENVLAMCDEVRRSGPYPLKVQRRSTAMQTAAWQHR
jgi:threonine dehydrogenase-like Zn-dependent dehydrogenase